MKEKNSAVGYVRVSSDDQIKGVSLDQQEEHVRRYCEQKGFKLLGIFREEGASARSLERPELRRLLEFCRSHHKQVKCIVAYDMSRWSRNTSDMQLLWQELTLGLHIELHCGGQILDPSSNSFLMAGLAVLIPHTDNLRKMEDVPVKMKAAAQLRGTWQWPAPIGYLNITDKRQPERMVPDPERAPFVRRAFELVANRAHKPKKVWQMLVDEGFRSRKGKRVAFSTFDRMVRNPIYMGVGLMTRWGERFKGNWKAIVSESLFYEVQRVLDGRRRTLAPYAKNNPLFPLRGDLLCPDCSNALTASPSRGKAGNLFNYYTCRNPDCDLTLNLRAEAAHAALRTHVAYLQRLQPRVKDFEEFKRALREVWEQHEGVAAKRQASLQRELKP